MTGGHEFFDTLVKYDEATQQQGKKMIKDFADQKALLRQLKAQRHQWLRCVKRYMGKKL